MKLSREELELRVLKHLLTSEKAILRAKRLRVTENHFMYCEEGSKSCYTRNIYRLIANYYDKSDGSLLTQMVFESKLIDYQVKDKERGKFMQFWAAIQDQEYNENELAELLSQLKSKRAVYLWSQMHQEAADKMNGENANLADTVTFVEERLEEIRNELDEFVMESHILELNNSADYWEVETRKRRDNPQKYRGIYCGIPELDNKTKGWLPGQVIVFIAPSSGGKSILLLGVSHYAWAVLGKNVLYHSFEMPEWDCLRRHISLAEHLSYELLKENTPTDEEITTIKARLAEWNGKSNYFEYDCTMDDPTPEYVEHRLRELSATKGKPDLIICDYIGNMQARDSRQQAPPWEKNGDAFTKLFALARRWEVPIITAQQLKQESIRENRQLKQKGKASAYAQDAASGDQRMMHFAHFVIGLEPDRPSSRTTFHPVKMRDAWFAPFGVEVISDFNEMRVLDPDEQKEWRELNGYEVDKTRADEGKSPTPKVKKADDNELVYEFGGTEETLSPEDLAIDFANWDIP